MIDSRPPSPVFLFWQTAASVVAAVLAGFALLMFASRPHAEALPNSLIGAMSGQKLAQGHERPSIVPSVPPLPSLERRMTILVMGVDSNGLNADRWASTRSDTMMVVSADPATGKVGLVSIPRDSRVKIPGHCTEKINAAHALGGPDLAVQCVRDVFGVQVDRYVVIDTQGLKKLFELVGPVEVLVENRMRYRDRAAHLEVDLEPGLQLLDPVQTEEYVRFRHDPRGDIGRIERQQWFLRQLASKLREPQVLFKLPQFFAFAKEYVVTNLTVEEMARLASFAREVKPDDVTTATLPGGSQTIHGGSYWLPDHAAARLVFERLIGPVLPPEAEAETASGSAGGPDGALAAAWQEEGQDRPLSVAIKYPRGSEGQAGDLERALNASGYRVRYKWQCPLSECSHEQIVQLSARADENATRMLKANVSALGDWPEVVLLESRPNVDFMVVLASTSHCGPSGAVTSPFARHVELALD